MISKKIVPKLTESALFHCFIVIIATIDGAEGFKSFTIPGLPGVVFLSPSCVANARQAAEALLHESMHLKFIDIDYFKCLFRIGFRPESSPKIRPPWHDYKEHAYWPIDRVLTSMHVYTSLVVYLGKLAVSLRADGAHLEFDSCSARALQCGDRASWLSDEAQNHFEYLTESGRSFVHWATDILSGLDPVAILSR